MMTEANTLEWARILKEYTLRNAGRHTRLEFDDPEIGAHWAEVDFPLRGVAFDPRDDRVEIMLGDIGSLDAHLTHSIAHPTSIDLAGGGQPGTDILRIAHGRGQTLLRFV
jgi:hypothetical protein